MIKKILESTISLLFLASITLLDSSLSAQNSSTNNPENEAHNEIRFSPEQLVDLAFKDCPELQQYLSTNHVQSSQYDKLQIADNLTRILELATPSIPSFGQGSTILNDSYFPADISRLLDPDREEAAKICALEALKRLSPESLAFIPSVLSLANKKTVSSNVKLSSLEASHRILSQTKGPIHEEVLNILFRQLEKHRQIQQTPITISLVSYLVKYNLDEVLLFSKRSPEIIPSLILALAGSDLDIAITFKILKEHAPAWENSSQTALLKQLHLFPSQATPYIIELLGELLPQLSKENSKLAMLALKDIANTPAEYSTYLSIHPLSDKIMKNYITFINTTNLKNRKLLISLLSPIDLAANSTLCEIPEIEITSPLLSEEPSAEYVNSLLLHSICPLKESQKKKMIQWIASENYAKKIIAISTLGHHEQFDDSSIKDLKKLLTELNRDKKNTEFEQLSSLFFHYLSQADFKKPLDDLVPLALENIQTPGEFPPLTNLILKTNRHPGSAFFLKHSRKFLSRVNELLSHKSAPVRLRAISIISSPEVTFSKNNIPALIDILDDPEASLRTAAFETLYKQVDTSSIKTFLQKIETGNVFERFYGSIILDLLWKNSPQKKQQTEKSTTGISQEKLGATYIASLHAIPCQERSAYTPVNLDSYFQTLDEKLKPELINRLIECFNAAENTEKPYRILSKLKPLPDIYAQQLEKHFKEKQTFYSSQEVFKKYMELYLLFNSKEKSLEFIRSYLEQSKGYDTINLFQWLTDHTEYQTEFTSDLDALLNVSYENRITNELNRLYLRVSSKQYTTENIYNDYRFLNDNHEALQFFTELLPKVELSEVLTSLKTKERFEPYFVNFKSTACAFSPFHDTCRTLFLDTRSALINHPSMIFSSLLFQFERYNDYKDCQSLENDYLLSCTERKDITFGEAIILLEKILLSGYWLHQVPSASSSELDTAVENRQSVAQSSNNKIGNLEQLVAINKIAMNTHAPYHIHVLLRLFQTKLLQNIETENSLIN